ncbi:TPA: hypothetical protein OTQ61_002283 [Citrobacter koseri]|nr:hypothetical protein [Citrobacter koseri]
MVSAGLLRESFATESYQQASEEGVMQKECGYCRKPVEEGKEVKSILFYRNGNRLANKEKEYCSKQCAEYDQMAHES